MTWRYIIVALVIVALVLICSVRCANEWCAQQQGQQDRVQTAMEEMLKSNPPAAGRGK